MMKKSEVKQAFPALVAAWKCERGFERTAAQELSFSDFLGWVRDNHPRYLNFRISTSPEYDMQQWFEDEIGLPSFYR